MKARYTHILFICALLCSIFTQAKAKDITIAMGNIEPYFIAQTNSGVFTDLIKAVFKHIPDYEPKFRFGLTNNVRWHLYNSNKIDAVANIFDSIKISSGCNTDHLFRFNDIAVTRKSSHLKLNNISDLQGHSIIAFEGAKVFFGDEFTQKAVSKNYYETRVQSSQARMLITKRVDISVGDLFIFLNALQLPENAGSSVKDFDFHYLFPRISTRMAFRDVNLCQQFNAALTLVKDSGEYEKIYDTYLNKFHFEKPATLN